MSEAERTNMPEEIRKASRRIIERRNELQNALNPNLSSIFEIQEQDGEVATD